MKKEWHRWTLSGEPIDNGNQPPAEKQKVARGDFVGL